MSQQYPDEDFGDAADRLYEEDRQRQLDEEQEYIVEWRIELSAPTPLDAALIAESIWTDPYALRPCLFVTDADGEQHLVDLANDED